MKKYTLGKLMVVVLLSVFVVPFGAHALLINEELQFGSRGPSVSALQTFLAADPSIYPEGLVTGYFGSLTRSAVIRYQARNGISQVGRVGPITLASINQGTGGIGGADDIDAPILSSLTIATTTTNGTQLATIRWTTNEDANGKVYFGSTYPLILDSAATMTDSSFDRTNVVTLPSLSLGQTRFFIIESTDIAGNVQRTVHQTLVVK